MTLSWLNVVDGLVILGALLFARLGWRYGLLAVLCSFGGFLLGGMIGTSLVSWLLGALNMHGTTRFLAALVGLASAIAGLIIAGRLGRRLRSHFSVGHLATADHIGGAILNVGVLAVIGWTLAATAITLPASMVSSQIRSSRLLANLDSVIPGQPRDMVTSIRGIIDESRLPQLFDGVGFFLPTEVPAPSAAVVSQPAVQLALSSVVRVEGRASTCDSGFSGSGFVVAKGRVLTNAHVVAGVSAPRVHVPGFGTMLRGRTVYFDPRVDVAILDVPGLTAKVLKMAGPAVRGDDGVIAGYPGGGELTVTSARVRGTIPSSMTAGTDIYGNPGVAREIYALRGVARAGDSGGPLLTSSGAVSGVVFAQGQGDDETAYALSGKQVAQAIAAATTDNQSVSTGACAS